MCPPHPFKLRAAGRAAKAKDDHAEEKPKPKKKAEEETNTGWTEPTTVMVKPPEQLDLTEKELAAEQTRILSAKDPSAPHNITRYSYQLQGQQQQGAQDRPDAPKINWEIISGNYVLEATVEQMATHFEMEGAYVFACVCALCVCMCACARAYIYIYIYIYISIYTKTHTHTHTHTVLYIYIYIYMYKYIHTHTHTHTHICIYIYIYIVSQISDVSE
jgi:hypothetical protein